MHDIRYIWREDIANKSSHPRNPFL